MIRLFQEQLDEGKTLKLTRKQFRKGFAALGAQLSDSDESLIFEALGESLSKGTRKGGRDGWIDG